MQTTLPTPDMLAREFATVLREWLTAQELREALELNRAEEHPNVCHSHDRCDANEAMAEALSRFGVELDIQNETHRALWCAAWDIAKSAEFSIDEQRTPSPLEACIEVEHRLAKYIEADDLADDTQHPLWPTRQYLRMVIEAQ